MNHLDSYATTKLQQWLRTRTNSIGPEVKILLERLHEFGLQVHTKGFDAALKKIGAPTGQVSTIILLESIANLLCRSERNTERAVAMKSLQETLLLCTAVEADLSPSEFGRQLETYLEVSGSRGLIGVFLGLHLSNLIFIHLQDSLRSTEWEIFEKQIRSIERVCQTTAGLSVRSWEKWPKLTDPMVISALDLLLAEMKKRFEAKGQSALPKS